MKYEIKKLFSSFFPKLSFITLVFFTILISIFAFSSYETADEDLSGKEALTYEKNLENEYKGILDEELIANILNRLETSGSEESFKVNLYRFYPTLSTTLIEAYKPIKINDKDLLTNIYETHGKDFYTRNISNIEDKLESAGSMVIDDNEKDLIIEIAKNIEKPYNFQYSAYWNLMFDLLKVIIMVSFIIIIFQISNVYSLEKENSMDIVISSSKKKICNTIIFDKVKAVFITISVESLFVFVLFLVVALYYTGLSGFNAPIQLKYFNSIYNWSFGKAIFFSMLISYLGFLAMGYITFLINLMTKKTFITMILGLSLFIIPGFLEGLSSVNNIFNKVVISLPINGITITKNLARIELGLFNTTQAGSLIIMSLFIIIICNIIIKIVWKRSI